MKVTTYMQRGGMFGLLLVCALVVPTRGNAQGEAAVPFLLISPDSRSSGMGEGGVATVNDVSAVSWNPGALAFLDGQEISLTHANWLPQFQQPDLFYDYLNYRNRIESIGGTASASVTYLNLGKFERRDENNNFLGTFNAYEFAVTVGYATKLADDLGAGINLRFIRSALAPFGTAEEKGSGIANTVSADIAMQWRPDELVLPLIDIDLGKKLSMGFNLSNLGPKITYIDAAQADPIPTLLRVGFGYKIFSDEYNSLTTGIDFSRLLVRRRSDGTSDPVWKALFTTWGDGSGLRRFDTSVGAEYWYGSPKLLALRVGHFFEDPSYGNRNFWTFGAGIRYDIYGFDFSYISAAQNHPLSDTIRLSLLIAWGGPDQQ